MLNKIKLKQIILYSLYYATMFTIAFCVDKLLQMLLFVVFFHFTQGCFYKTFQPDVIEKDPIKAIKYYNFTKFCFELNFLIICNNFDISIYSNILEIFVIAAFNALLRYLFEKMIIEKQNILKDKDKLIQMCKEVGVKDDMIQRMIWKYVDGKTYEEIASIERVEMETVKQSIRRTRKKLNITSEMS